MASFVGQVLLVARVGVWGWSRDRNAAGRVFGLRLSWSLLVGGGGEVEMAGEGFLV